MRKVLIVTDMLNDFLKTGGTLYTESMRSIIPAVEAKIKEYLNAGYLVIFLCDAHAEGDKEFRLFPDHALINTWGAKMIDELTIFIPHVTMVAKTRFSGTFNTTLLHTLEEGDEIELAGVCSSICIMDTAGGLVNADYSVTVDRNCIADLTDKWHELAMERMETIYGVKIIG
jgi:nicotinamidase-related amidase